MKRFLYHDLIVAGTWCNLKCSYCTSVQDANAFGTETSESRRGRGASIAIPDVLALLDGMSCHVDAPVMKVSGGELFLLANAAELIEELSARYAHVQVLTNGTELTAVTIERIARLDNVAFNLSLDGHTAEMNALRWRSAQIGARVTAAFDAMVRNVRRLEITAVVSNVNTPGFPAFLDHLLRQPCAVVVVPTPVRGIHAGTLFGPEARAAFAAFLRDAGPSAWQVLPPAAYCEALAELLTSPGDRTQRCHLPNTAIQVFDTGAVTPCPVGWTAEIGNIKRDGIEAVAAQVGTHKMYDLLTRPRPRVPVCRTCFSQADILNLYLEDRITLEEMARLPLFAAAPAQSRLVELRSRRH